MCLLCIIQYCRFFYIAPQPHVLDYPTTPWSEYEPLTTTTTSTPRLLYRMTAMIQDLGDVEYVQVADSYNDNADPHNDSDDNNLVFVERQAVVVVTDYDKPTMEQGNNDGHDHPLHYPQPPVGKRLRTQSAPTTLCLYVYTGRRHEDAPPLQLHQLLEWIILPEPHEGDSLTPPSSSSSSSLSLFSPWWHNDDEQRTQQHYHHPHYPRAHAVAATPVTVDAVWLHRQTRILAQPLSTPAAAVQIVAQALHVTVPVATALWLTLLARAEPPRRRYQTTTTTNHHSRPPPPLVGNFALHLAVPYSSAAVWRRSLQRLLQPLVLRTVVRGDECDKNTVLRQHHGRITGSWQYPAGTTVLLDQTNNSNDNNHNPTADALVSTFHVPLHCDGGQICWLPADWRVIVLQTTNNNNNNTQPCIDLSNVTPGYTAPDRHRQWAVTLATLRETIPTVSLDSTLAEHIPHAFGQLRQARANNNNNNNNNNVINETSLGRWLTWTRLWARAHGRATAVRADWEQALQLDAALGWS